MSTDALLLLRRSSAHSVVLTLGPTSRYRIAVFVKRQDNDDGLQPWEANYKKIGAIGAGIVAHKSLRSEVVRVGNDTISSVVQAYVH